VQNVPPATVSLPPEVALLVIGVCAGLVGGLLGVGGGIVMIPSLVLFFGDHAYGPNTFHAFKLAAITTSIVLSVPAAVRHARARAVLYPMLPGIIPLALVGVIAGVLVARTFVGEWAVLLRRIFGGFLELAVVIGVAQDWRTAHGEVYLCRSCPLPGRRTLLGLLVGLPAGIIAGLLGVGGGIWAVPAQNLLLGVRLKSAIANSSVMIVAVALVTSAALALSIAGLPGDMALPLRGWWLTLWLTPGALVGGWCGADLTHRLPVRWLRRAFWAALGVAGVRMIAG
jgi:uncharacterized membrane protein YfcA